MIFATIIVVLVIHDLIKDNKSEHHQIIVANWESLDLSGPVKGIEDAEVNIIKFFDYGCSFCREMNYEINKFIENYPNEVSVKYVNYPIIDETSYKAALGSYCSTRYGLFGKVHEYSYLNQDRLGEDGLYYDIRSINNDDVDKLYGCMSDEGVVNTINNNLKIGRHIGINSVPAVIINGKLYSGFHDKDQLIELVSSLEGGS